MFHVAFVCDLIALLAPTANTTLYSLSLSVIMGVEMLSFLSLATAANVTQLHNNSTLVSGRVNRTQLLLLLLLVLREQLFFSLFFYCRFAFRLCRRQ